MVWALLAALGGGGAAVAAEGPASAKSPSARSPSAATPAPPAPAANDAAAESGPGADAKAAAAGLPIPRFVSLRTNPINMRTGPGVRYPVDWVYVRRYLPVEVIGEFETWRRIRDPEGAEGWVHQNMLSGKRTAVVTQTAAGLKRAAADTAEITATLEPGVIVNLLRCPADSGYCRVEVTGLQGWLRRDQFWGAYPNEGLQ